MEARRLSIMLPLLALLIAVLMLSNLACGGELPAEENGGKAPENGQEIEQDEGVAEGPLAATVEAMKVVSYRVEGEISFNLLEPEVPGAEPVFKGGVGMPYKAEHQAGGGTSKSHMLIDLKNMDTSDMPPALIPEGKSQETFLADGVFYCQDPEGWHQVPFDPSEVLLDMNVMGLLPEDVINWVEHAETVTPAEEDAEVASYVLKPGSAYLQAVKEAAQKLYAGEEWKKKEQELQGLEKVLPSFNVYVVVYKESKRIEEVEFFYEGKVTDLTGPLGEDDAMADMSFQVSGFLLYKGYGEPVQITLP